MRKARLVGVTPIVTALLITDCGSSSTKTASTPADSTAATSNNPYAQSTSASSSSSATVALITTKHDSKLGTIVVYGPKHLTVYLFGGDKGQSSSCTSACASLWPPVTGKPQAGGSAKNSGLGTIRRPDGTTQVTYSGHPLYLYVKDEDDGDAYGQGLTAFGAAWYALASSGKKVDLS